MRILESIVDLVLAAAKWLALPIVVLLFLQWPLRSIIGLYSREANDLGQWLFALYVAVSITAATRAGTHLAADTVARNYSAATRDWLARAGALHAGDTSRVVVAGSSGLGPLARRSRAPVALSASPDLSQLPPHRHALGPQARELSRLHSPRLYSHTTSPSF